MTKPSSRLMMDAPNAASSVPQAETSRVSRRAFVQQSVRGAAALGALTALPTAQAASATSSAPCGSVIPSHWDETFDVIVVGSGLAGFCAGITAAELGRKTVILEKMGVPGGSSVISGGTFAACNTPAQAKAGIQDSVELYMADVLKAGQRLNVPALVRTMCEQSADGLKFLMDRGAQYNPELRKVAGHSVMRCFQPLYNNGLSVIQPLYRHYHTLANASLRLRTKVDELIRDASGRVVGLKVRVAYLFDPASPADDRLNKTGVVKYFRARRGVVFATGGFSRDFEFRSREFPQYNKVPSTVQLGATAGALKAMMAAGARSIHLAHVRFAISIGYEDIEKGLLVDQRTGKRFINEGAPRMGLSYKIIDVVNAGSDWPALIYDEKGLATLYDRDKLNIILNNGEMPKFATLAELAAHFKIPEKALIETVDRYNGFLKAGKDEEFGKDFAKTHSVPVLEGPFYACPVYPKFNYSQGGIAIDERTRAISAEDNEIIPGLYVCGEASGGVHGAVRVTGCSMSDCTVFGRIAGAEAAKAEPTDVVTVAKH